LRTLLYANVLHCIRDAKLLPWQYWLCARLLPVNAAGYAAGWAVALSVLRQCQPGSRWQCRLSSSVDNSITLGNLDYSKTRWNSTGCHRRLCLRLLWPWPLTFWPQKLTSTSTNPNTSVTKVWRNSLHWFMRYDVHKVFRTHRLTHALIHSITDGQTSRPHRWVAQGRCFYDAKNGW